MGDTSEQAEVPRKSTTKIIIAVCPGKEIINIVLFIFNRTHTVQERMKEKPAGRTKWILPSLYKNDTLKKA